MGDSGECEINTLDKYLNNLFHGEIEFGLSDEEVFEIQKGIEYLVNLITGAIDKDVTQLKKDISIKFMNLYPEHRFICDGNYDGYKIIKVGSYYEHTKNGYPDEFDFIYVLSTFAVDGYKSREMFWRENYMILNPLHDAIKEFLRCRQIELPNECFVTEEGNMILFRGYDRTEGPSSKLKFSYFNCDTAEIKYIYVDIVPSFKIIDRQIRSRIKKVCHLKDFAREVIATGSYLITKEVSFTMTEVHFILNVLSNKHRKAYRILKYLFNGNRDGNILNSSTTSSGGITSYMIKVAIIHHHCTCKHHGLKLSECVIKVLEDLQHFCNHYMDLAEDNQLRKLNGGQFSLRLIVVMQTVHHLRKLLMKLELMKVLDLQLKIKPMIIHILTETENRSSVGERSRNRSLKSSFFSLSMSNKTTGSKSDDEWEDDLASVTFGALKYRQKYNDNAHVNVKRYKVSRKNLNRQENGSVLHPRFFETPENENSYPSSVEQSDYDENMDLMSINISAVSASIDDDGPSFRMHADENRSWNSTVTNIYMRTPTTNSGRDIGFRVNTRRKQSRRRSYATNDSVSEFHDSVVSFSVSGMPDDRENVSVWTGKQKQDQASMTKYLGDREKHKGKINCCNCVLL